MTNTDGRPRITVGMALHRSAPYVDVVSANIERIADDDVEILLSDCTGRDDALEQLRARHGADPRIMFFSGDERYGWVDHYNALVRRARGTFFVWMAHDDDFPPEYLPRLGAALDAHPDALLAFGTIRLVDPAGAPVEVPYLPALPVALGTGPRSSEVIALVQHWNTAIASRGMFRRDEILRRRLRLRHTLGDVDADANWVVAVASSGPIVFEPSVHCVKRVTPGSGSAGWPARRGTVLSRLEVAPLTARYLVSARVPLRDAAPILRFVTVRSVQHALWFAPDGVRELLPASVRRRVGQRLKHQVRRLGTAAPETR